MERGYGFGEIVKMAEVGIECVEGEEVIEDGVPCLQSLLGDVVS